jgi:hypothetical protein
MGMRKSDKFLVRFLLTTFFILAGGLALWVNLR